MSNASERREDFVQSWSGPLKPKSGLGHPSHISANSDYLAITTVVQELLSLGRSRFAAMWISSRGRSPRMIGQ
jgi:hypothetical protein